MKSPMHHAPYAETTKRLEDLWGELAEKERRVAELRGEVDVRIAGHQRSQAEKLADGEVVSVTPLDAVYGEIDRLVAERRVVVQAIDLVKQRQAAALSEASRLACEAAAAKHAEKVRAVVAAVIQLAHANEGERAVRDELEQAGFRVYLRPMSFAYLGGLEDYSGAAIYLLEALEHGYLDAATFKKLTNGRITPPAPRRSAAEAAAASAVEITKAIAGWARVFMKKTIATPELTLAERTHVILPAGKARELVAEGFAEPSSTPPTMDEIHQVKKDLA